MKPRGYAFAILPSTWTSQHRLSWPQLPKWHVCTCIHTYIDTCLLTYPTCLRAYLPIYLHKYIQTYVYVCTHMYICEDVCFSFLCIHMCIYIYAHTCTCIHTYTQREMHIYIYIEIYVCSVTNLDVAIGMGAVEGQVSPNGPSALRSSARSPAAAAALRGASRASAPAARGAYLDPNSMLNSSQ